MNIRTITLGLAAIAVALLGFATGSPPAHVPKLPPLRLLATRQGPAGVLSALNANLSSGAATPGSTVTCSLGGVLNSLSVGVQGAYSMTLVVQVTADNANWITVPNSSYAKVSDGTTGAISGSGMWTVPVSGLSARVTCSAYTSGSATVRLIPYSAAGGAGGGGSGGAVTSVDGGIVTLGSDADSATAGAGSANAHLREIATLLSGTIGITGTITSALPSGTNNIGAVNVTASSSGGSTAFTNSGSAITTAVTVDASAGSFYDYAATNTNASTGYWVEFFNASSGSITLGTTPPVWMMYVPPGPSGTVEHFAMPHAFSTALSVAFVTSPDGALAAPSSTCYASVSYK